jgi:hypothetical protein
LFTDISINAKKYKNNKNNKNIHFEGKARFLRGEDLKASLLGLFSSAVALWRCYVFPQVHVTKVKKSIIVVRIKNVCFIK